MRWMWISLLALGCPGPEEETDDPPTPFEQYINTSVELRTASGGVPDLSCYTPGEDYESTTWGTQDVDTTKQVLLSTDFLIEDFESDEPVDDATVEIWTNDEVSGAPDFDGTSDENGELAFADFPLCQAFSARVQTDPLLDETKTSITAHGVTDYAESTAADTLTSVSKVTFQLIPGILGITPDPSASIVAGTAYDCARGEELEGAQIVVYDENGEVTDPEVTKVKYFIDEFPARDQTTTSADGLWVAVNVPPGNVRVEMWGVVEGELQLLGATKLQSYADSINLSNLTAGLDGVWYPDSCLVAR